MNDHPLLDQLENGPWPQFVADLKRRASMEKIADNYYRFKEFAHPSDGVTMIMTIDKIDGENLDTAVSLDGGFTVAGSERKEFVKRLGNLIDEFRI